MSASKSAVPTFNVIKENNDSVIESGENKDDTESIASDQEKNTTNEIGDVNEIEDVELDSDPEEDDVGEEGDDDEEDDVGEEGDDDDEDDDEDDVGEEGDDDDEDEDEDDDEEDEDEDKLTVKSKKNLKDDSNRTKNTAISEITLDSLLSNAVTGNDSDVESDADTDTDTDDEHIFKKFKQEVQGNFFKENHPSVILDDNETVLQKSVIKRDANGNIQDDNHKTNPFMSRYEITRVLGTRAEQLNAGAPAFVVPPTGVIDGYQIARLELQQKKIPFIIRRPLPDKTHEYWNVKDLEILRDI